MIMSPNLRNKSNDSVYFAVKLTINGIFKGKCYEFGNFYVVSDARNNDRVNWVVGNRLTGERYDFSNPAKAAELFLKGVWGEQLLELM